MVRRLLPSPTQNRSAGSGPVTMPGFELAPAEGGCPVALPPGETVIGRGPLLGITDKRVSRSHAILKAVGDKLTIKPVHINPCFYRPSKSSQLLPLDTDKWHQLSPGDHFSLLVDKYVFRILFTPSKEESLLRINRNLSAEEIPNQIPSVLQPIKMSHRKPSLQQTSSPSKSQLLETHSTVERAAEIPPKLSASIIENEDPKPSKRKRVLPAWMLQADLMVQSSSASITVRGNSEETIKGPGKKQRTTANDDAAHSTQDIQRISTEPVVRKMEKNGSKMVSEIPETSVGHTDWQLQNEELMLNSDTKSKKDSKLKYVDSKTEQAYQGEPLQPPAEESETQDLTPDRLTETEHSDLTESQDIPQSSNIIKPKRTPCLYGRSCYRKNPIHFQQFSHPGDSDYDDMNAVTQTDDDSRPECPYGTACYRKNPQHKLEYKHTAPPEPEKRQMKQKAIKKGRSVLDDDSDDNGEPNEYNLDDSFIDDEEEEEYDPTDEDSDWEPDCQDKDHEDVDTLLKEAQTFVKNKK